MDARLKATGLKTIRGQLERLQKEHASGWQDTVANSLVKEIREKAPKDTGKYAKSWTVKQRKNRTKYKTVIHIAPSKKFQKLFGWLEFTGTIPHEILPVRALYLHWIDKETGMHHFRKRVWHPGTDPTPHVRPAMRKILPRSMQQAIKGISTKHVWLKR